jgi:hypothetical protein
VDQLLWASANLLLLGAKWIGVAQTSDGRRTYWQWKSLGIEMNEVIAFAHNRA